MKIINLTFLKRTLLWGGLHFVVTLGALLASLESLGHFDDPNWEPSLISKIGETASNVLLFPAANIMSSWGGRAFRGAAGFHGPQGAAKSRF